MSRERTVLYIGGLGRSGSTLLERMLGQVDGVTTAGELVSFWERARDARSLCGCGRPIEQCAHWNKILAQGIDITRGRALQRKVDRTRFLPFLLVPRLWPRFRRRLDEYVAALDTLYGAIADVTGADVIVDSSKRPSGPYVLHNSHTIDLRVVVMVRDSRGVAYSWTKHRQTEPRSDAPQMHRLSATRTGLRWMWHNLVYEGCQIHSIATKRVFYEDLVHRPEETLRDVCAFAGIPLAPRATDFISSDSAELDLVGHTVTGNPIRFDLGRVLLTEDCEWESALPAAQRRSVTIVTAPLLAFYGYGLERGRTHRR